MSAIRSSADMDGPNRRDFLKLATSTLLGASGILGLGAIFRFLDFQAGPKPITEFDLGPASTYPVGSRTPLVVVPALLTRNASGFSAISLICTHLGCTVEVSGNGFACPCHGSHFDEQGRVLRGPALKPLPSLRLEINANGHLILHTD